jgi:AAA domain
LKSVALKESQKVVEIVSAAKGPDAGAGWAGSAAWTTERPGQESEPMMRSFDAWVFARLTSGQACDGLLETVHPRFRSLAHYLAKVELSSRPIAMGGYLASQRDRDAVYKAMADADPLGPAPSPSAGELRPACALDLDQASVGVKWAWPRWIPRGRVSGVGGFEGTGKTRFALDLARRAYHGVPWPDGEPMTLPAGSPSLWICGDGHQEEIAGAARKMNIPLEAVLFNASPEDPCTGVDLDDPAAIESLDAFLEISAAPLVFIDTLTNSTSRDLCRQNDVKALLSPLQEIAQRRQVAIALLLHLSREGQALGRRTKGLTRTLIHLECPDSDQPARLRLWVEKSFDVKPPALGVTMGEDGNEYDNDPPDGGDEDVSAPRKRGRVPVKLDACKEWLADQLVTQPVPVKDVRALAADAGYATTTLYKAAGSLEVAEYSVDGRKWWRLPDPSFVPLVSIVSAPGFET